MRNDMFTIERFRVMRNLAEDTSSRVILDLGAGWNPISEGVVSQKTIRVDGQKEYNPNIVFNFNQKKFPLEDNFAHLVFAGEILEHLTNPFIFLKEINRVLKKEGVLILSTPNINSFKNRIKVLLGKIPNFNAHKYPTEEDQIWNHQSDWNLKLLKEFLTKANFEIEIATSSGVIYKNKILLKNSLCPPPSQIF